MSLDQPAGFVKSHSVSKDRFLGGRLMIGQFENGFRAGTDSVLLGATIDPNSRELLDLGAGAGVAGLVALGFNPELRATFAERDEDLVQLARENVAANGFAERGQVLISDVTAPGAIRRKAGLRLDHYSSVIANPPFFASESATLPPEAGRAAARHQKSGEIELWVRTAASSAAPRGEAIFLYPAEGLAALLFAMEDRFGAIDVLPLSPRPGDAANRVLVRGIKGSRAPLRLCAPLYLHGETGNAFSDSVRGITMGERPLDWQRRR